MISMPIRTGVNRGYPQAFEFFQQAKPIKISLLAIKL